MERRDLGEINIRRTRPSDDWCKGTEEIVLSLRQERMFSLVRTDLGGWKISMCNVTLGVNRTHHRHVCSRKA